MESWSARTRRPHVKVFKEERDLTILLLVDISSSQSFGSKKSREKVSAAAELAALFAILATKNNDRVGLVVFTDEVEHFIPPLGESSCFQFGARRSNNEA